MPAHNIPNGHAHALVSAPNSPLAHRLMKNNGGPPPVTPQRIARANRSSAILRDPISPASATGTPYTSQNRSFASAVSSDASILVTPQSVQSVLGAAVRQVSAGESPLVQKAIRKKSAADVTENWRSRASENGIRVRSSESQFGDDEDDDGFIIASTPFNKVHQRAQTSEEQLLPPPFLSSQRRSRSNSLAQMGRSAVPAAPAVLASMQTPDRRTLSTLATLNTPPPNSSVVSKLKQKGSSTDPAYPRRRTVLGQTPAAGLFNIDEDGYLASDPQPYAFDVQPIDNSFMSFADPDPFHMTAPALSPIMEQRLNEDRLHSNSLPLDLGAHLGPFCDIHDSSVVDLSSYGLSEPEVDDSFLDFGTLNTTIDPTCSVCGAVEANRIAVLDPCRHPLCSACLTSALNIVGEKDMHCAVCDAGVNNFHLQAVGTDTTGAQESMAEGAAGIVSPTRARTRTASAAVSRRGSALLPSAFSDAGSPTRRSSAHSKESPFFFDNGIPLGASTPAFNPSLVLDTEHVVLRIDNVPWDITPPAIRAWLKHPVERVHVLLDRKGKTLSHAYVELANEDLAKAALRTAQNSVLGKGKRARGVTVTKTSQAELMRALFPSWQGSFDGCRPTLDGLSHEHARLAREHGLLSESELKSLLHLVRSPDSHFLKVPSLPFYSVMSILAKFPCDQDGKVSWSGSLRDMLFDITYSAVDVLVTRERETPSTENSELLLALVEHALSCRAFTREQIGKLSSIAAHVVETSFSPPSSGSSPTQYRASIHGSPEALHDPAIAAAVRSHGHGMIPPVAPASRRVSGPYVQPEIPIQLREMNAVPEHFQRMRIGHAKPQFGAVHYQDILAHQAYLAQLQHAAHAQVSGLTGRQSFDALAREFGVEEGLVAALAERLGGMA